MCGRYYRQSDKQRIAEAFQLGKLEELGAELAPNYNVAPTTMQPVVVQDRDSGARALRMMRWGLIPGWCRNPRELGLSTINAKAESLTEKPMWRAPFAKRRCLVIADGWYEWKRIAEKQKQPYALARKDDAPLAFGGLWEHWKAPDGTMEMDTYSIITTEANETSAAVHARMPLILPVRDYARWLEPSVAERLPVDLLRPLPGEETMAWAVSNRVGNVRNNDRGLVERVG